MTRTWPVLITSLLALFSPAAVNYAAAERDCRGENMTCTSNCTRMIPGYGPAERAVQDGCMSNCRNAQWFCGRENDLERQRAEQARAEELRRQAEAARASMSEAERQRQSLERERNFQRPTFQWR